MAKASLQEAKAPGPGSLTERKEKAEAVDVKGESKPQEPKAVAAEAPATEQRAQLTVQAPGGPEAPRIRKEIDSESIRTWLTPIALGDDERLAKLTELICAALADEHGFNRSGLLARLLPHTGGIGLEAMASLEDLLDWLEQERGQAGPPPADPRIGRSSEEPGLRRWAVGDAVVLRQLKGRPELNGRRATVVQAPGPHEQVSSRCTVVLEEPLQDGRVQLSVKPENLRPAGQAAEAPQAGGGGDAPQAGREPPQAEGGGAGPGPPGGGAAPGPRGAGGVFGSNLERLRARAEAERREGPPSRGRGRGPGAGRGYGKGRRGAGAWDEQALREPVAFVPAEQQPVCSRAVVVVDPRGQGVGDGASDDEHGEGTPGQILPPAQPPAQARSPQQQPRAAPAAAAAPEARRAAPPPEGNLTLAVSAGAREEDRAQREAQEKRSRLDQSRREMIAKLTKQLQVCLARVQKGDLDDRAKEKFQDMIATLRAQMDKVSGVP